MAQIRERQGKKGVRYTAVVRLEGQSRTATFSTKPQAKKWAKLIEADIIRGKHLPPTESKKRSVGDLMLRYIETVIPNQKDQKNPKRHESSGLNRLAI